MIVQYVGHSGVAPRPYEYYCIQQYTCLRKRWNVSCVFTAGALAALRLERPLTARPQVYTYLFYLHYKVLVQQVCHLRVCAVFHAASSGGAAS
jgi:hypothetical protein